MTGYRNLNLGMTWVSGNCVVCRAAANSLANKWTEEKLKLLLSGYAAEDVFKEIEMALFSKIFPAEKLLQSK